jgi:hypothetical protein
MSNMGKKRYRELRGLFCGYLIEEWNSQRDVGFQVVDADLYSMRSSTLEPDSEPRKLRLWHTRGIDPLL